MMLSLLFKIRKCTNYQQGIVHLILLETVYSSIILVLATCSEDKRLGFLDGTGKVAHIIKKAHP